MEPIALYAFLLGRFLLGGYFAWNGLNHLLQSKTMEGYAASKGVPFPRLAVVGSGLLILLGGLGILTGAYVGLSVCALVVFIVPVSVMMHGFWNVSEPNARMMEMILFAKNMALLGAVLMLLAIPTPWVFAL